MLRSYLYRHRRFVIEVTFASGAIWTYGLWRDKREAQAMLDTRWAHDPTPDPHALYADVVSAHVRLRHAGEPTRDKRDLMGRRFVQV